MDEISRCYQVLGLEIGSSQEEVKRAYRDLVRVWHPDRFSHDERLQVVAQDKLKEINGAYETLNAKFFNDSISPPSQEEPIPSEPGPEVAPVDEPLSPPGTDGARRKLVIGVVAAIVGLLVLVATAGIYWKHRTPGIVAPVEPVAVYHPELKDFEMILKDGSAAYTGNWIVATSAKDRHAKSYRHTTTVGGTPTATATFTPIIPATGNYDLYVWYSQGANRATNTPFEVMHDGEKLDVSVNQTTKGGRWQRIAQEVRFKQGTNGYVRLSNNTGETGRVIISDSVRFVYSATQ
jgi:hypothetical protein